MIRFLQRIFRPQRCVLNSKTPYSDFIEWLNKDPMNYTIWRFWRDAYDKEFRE